MPVFPNTYRQYCHLLAKNQAYVITGVVEEQFSTVTITVRTLRLLSTHPMEATIEPVEEVSVQPYPSGFPTPKWHRPPEHTLRRVRTQMGNDQ